MRRSLACAWLIAGAALVAGCAETDPNAHVWLREGEQAYQAHQYSRAIEQLSLYLNQARGTPDAARAHYVRGMSLAMAGRRAQAYTDLQQAARASDSDIAWRAEAVLGVLYFEDQNWSAAAGALTSAASRAPDATPQDALLYRLGLCQERLGRWSDAQATYRRLLAASPQKAYADLARRRVELGADHFAIQCGVFAQRESADQLLGELKQKGLPAHARRETRDGEPRYVVLVGRYRTYTDAVAALASVRGHIPSAVLWP